MDGEGEADGGGEIFVSLINAKSVTKGAGEVEEEGNPLARTEHDTKLARNEIPSVVSLFDDPANHVP